MVRRYLFLYSVLITFAMLQIVSKAQAAPTIKVKWSDYKSQIAFASGQDVVIPENIVLLFDGNGLNDKIHKLTVTGGFKCAPGPRTIEVEAVLVSGSRAFFECGNDLAPRKDTFMIHMSGVSEFSHAEMMESCPSMSMDNMPMHSSGAQGLVVICGARLSLKGATSATLWTQLTATAMPGESTIQLKDATGWAIGSKLAIASSSFNHQEAEEVTIVGKTKSGALQLDRPLAFKHWGDLSLVYGKDDLQIPLNDQAEVGLLSRAIVFQGTEDLSLAAISAQLDKKAAHMMFMSTPGTIHIDGVEFLNVGRMGELGRYPIHWHKVGDTFGNYIINSSIHNSFNRCLTVHETNGVVVRNNVCFNHFGHGYFLEEGNETNNTFDHNLGILSKKVPANRAILTTDYTSDSQDRYPAPATFWISNPNNTYTNNVAAGSDGTGFWFALKDLTHKPDGIVSPATETDLKLFEGNTAHSNSNGFSIDGGPNGVCAGNPLNNCTDSMAFDVDSADFKTYMTNYTPPHPAILNKLTVYKNRNYGFWHRGQGGSVIQNSIFADNPVAVGLVFDTALRNSVVILKTPHFDPATELIQTLFLPEQKRFAAALIYDGPSSLDHVYFDGFPETLSYTVAANLGTPSKTYTYHPSLFKLTVAASSRSPIHRTQHLLFGTQMTSLRADLRHNLGHPSKDNWSAGVWDIDGSLTGIANTTIVPEEDISHYSNCQVDPVRFPNSLVCPSRFGQIFLANGSLKFDLSRKGSDGQSGQYLLPTAPEPGYPDMVPGAPYTDHQFSFSTDRAAIDTYSVRIDQSVNLSQPVLIKLNGVRKGETSPALEIYQIGHNCKLISPMTAGISVGQSDGGVLRIRMTATDISKPGWDPENYSSTALMQCYVPNTASFSSPTALRSGCWYPEGPRVVGCAQNSVFELSVTGAELTMKAVVGPNRGMAKLTIDGQSAGTMRIGEIKPSFEGDPE